MIFTDLRKVMFTDAEGGGEHHFSKQRPVKQSFCVSLRRDGHWKCLILSLLIYGCLTAIIWCRLAVITTVVVYYDRYLSQREFNDGSPCADGYIYIPVAFVILLYLVYLVECWHCHTRIELKHKVDVQTVYHKMRQMRESFPIVWWKAICYHYVRRTRQVTRYRNGDSFTSTQVYYERMNTHSAGCAFNFTNCGVKDASKVITGLDEYPATKIRFTKSYSFANEDSHYEFEDQRSQFFLENEQRDDYMETTEGMDLLNVNFKEYMIAFKDPDNLPWYVSHVIFWIASCLLLSWPLRVIIEYKTAYIHYHVHKIFGTNYANPDQLANGPITRVNTSASTELELCIRNNFTVVPSYSEALLMDGNATSSHTLHDANANVTSPVLGPTRSMTWNNMSESSSNGYISGFFSSANLPTMQHFNSCNLVNDVTLVQSESDQAHANSSSIRNLFRSPWSRRKRKRIPQSGSTPHRMFALSSPESPDDYAIAVDQRLSCARLTRNYSSIDEIRSRDSGTMSQTSISNRPSSYSLASSRSTQLVVSSNQNTNFEIPSSPVMHTIVEVNTPKKVARTGEKTSPNPVRPTSIRTLPIPLLTCAGNGCNIINKETNSADTAPFIRTNLPNVAVNNIVPHTPSPSQYRNSFASTSQASQGSTGYQTMTPTPGSPPCYADALQMYRPTEVSQGNHGSMAVSQPNYGSIGVSQTNQESETPPLLNATDRPRRNYRAIMETCL